MDIWVKERGKEMKRIKKKTDENKGIEKSGDEKKGKIKREGNQQRWTDKHGQSNVWRMKDKASWVRGKWRPIACDQTKEEKTVETLQKGFT